MLKKTQIITLASFGIILNCACLLADNSSSTLVQPNSYMSAAADKEESVDSKIDMKKLSEAFGNSLGRNLEMPGISFDLDSIIKGMQEGAQHKPSPLTEKEFEEMLAAVQEKAFKAKSAENLKLADEFIKKNQNEAGVIELVPGKLQYLVLKTGTGATVEPHSSPDISYVGKYQGGEIFGSSEELGGSVTIPLDQTIPGFSKGIVGMKEGEKRRLFIHPDLGYGTTGQLPPNELLVFDIEVVKANSDKSKAASSGKIDEESEDDSDESSDDDDGDGDYYFDENEEGSQDSNSQKIKSTN